MKSNQPVHFTEDEIMLTEAMDYHMGIEDCCGRLVDKKWTVKDNKLNIVFHCLLCHNEVIVIRTKVK